tara:strand:- start:2082 stop:2828 length:747 start_codon:yes stop_codon:yes gene_type:complete
MGLPTITVPQYTLTIPSSGKEVKYRPFLVKEEKILLIAMETEDQLQMVEATKTIINNCVFGDVDVNNMPTFDLEYIFLQLRAKAKGEDIELKFVCPTCEGEMKTKINVDQIQVIKPDGHDTNIKLADNLGVVMKYPTVDLQAAIETETKEKSQIDALFFTIIKSIDYIYDQENTYPSKDHTETEMTDFVESLTDTHFQKISNFFETMPKLKHEIELHCTNKVKGKGKEKKICGHKEKQMLEGLANFFD